MKPYGDVALSICRLYVADGGQKSITMINLNDGQKVQSMVISSLAINDVTVYQVSM